MNVLILHGIQGHAGNHWQGWLRDELTKRGHNAVMPEMPNAIRPDRTTWLDEIKRLMAQLQPSETVIVGHSLGVTSALDYIEQAAEPILGLVSVSGFYYPLGHELNEYFLIEKEIDMAKVKDNVNKVFVLYGDNDPYVDEKDLRAVASALGVEPQIFVGGGHLNTDAGYTTFPAILEIMKTLDKGIS